MILAQQADESWWEPWFPAATALVVTVALVVGVRWLLRRRQTDDDAERDFRSQVATIGLCLLGLLAVIFLLPEGSDSDLAFSVVGLIVTGALAISSQSIIANAMAGLMLRSVSSFKPGDFIEVGDHMGRVSELGLFHTEIQTADRDLITLPNSLMVNQPVRVVRSSGTIVSATASIGYDVSRHQLEGLFIEAAKSSGLIDPFVQVLELGDYSVNYRIAGFLDDPRGLLAARSKLRAAILDTLSAAGIEIMSPMYIARRSASNEALLPHDAGQPATAAWRRTAEDRVFDKAELAARLETSRDELTEARESLEELTNELARVDESERAELQTGITRFELRIERLQRRITRLQAEHSEG
jgi:small-conductance mechanosensitive channel